MKYEQLFENQIKDIKSIDKDVSAYNFYEFKAYNDKIHTIYHRIRYFLKEDTNYYQDKLSTMIQVDLKLKRVYFTSYSPNQTREMSIDDFGKILDSSIRNEKENNNALVTYFRAIRNLIQ